MNTKQDRSRLFIGAILILAGAFFLFGELIDMVFNIRIGYYTWPFTIIVPGLLLYLMAFITDEKASRGLVAAGSIVSAVGLLLFFQNITGWWATWAYAWAFIFPTSVGLGLMLFGLLRNQNNLVREGWRFTRPGLIILLLGVVFFELLIGISGFQFFGLRWICFPTALILLGIAIILRYLLPGKQPTAPVPPKPAPVEPKSDAAVPSPMTGSVQPEAQETPEAEQDETTWESGAEQDTKQE